MSKKIVPKRISEKELKQIEKKITSELEPFLSFMRRMDKKSTERTLFMQALEDYAKKMHNVLDMLDFVTKDIDALAGLLDPEKDVSRVTVKDSIYLTFVYLGYIESVGNCLTDIIVMLLVANGKDFHIERAYGTPRIKHAVSMGDLEKERVSLTTKLNFLKENGISELTSVIDSEARNAIAHLRLKVKGDMIYIKGKPAPILSYVGLRKLLTAISTTNHLVTQLAEEGNNHEQSK